MSFQILKIKNIPIKLHFTLIFIFVFLTWTLSVGFMPHYYPNLTRTEYVVMGVTGAIILFVSVLIHELAHSILSIKYGVKVDQIILFIFGGISEIKEETRDFRKEFKIAVIGPLTSFGVGGIFLSFFLLITFLGPEATEAQTYIQVLKGVLLYGFIVNILLGVFNLLPAFPMDGGRMLRAALVRWLDYQRATKISVQVGIIISFVLIGLGILVIIRASPIGGLWLILIGWFIQSGAKAYLQQFELSNLLKDMKLKDIMNTSFVSVKPDLSIRNLISDYFDVYRKGSFPVIDDHSVLLGMISTDDILDKGESLFEKKTMDIMQPLSNLIVMKSDMQVNNALEQLVRKRMNRIFVVDDYFKLIGIVSKTDILNAAQERADYDEILKYTRKSRGLMEGPNKKINKADSDST
ncbi:MAG TPA: site-2 protease family protein [Nitrososphaeraceae archaeon]|nr:site-2 protease family protein [Nitrososphaeraceae archaeon]